MMIAQPNGTRLSVQGGRTALGRSLGLPRLTAASTPVLEGKTLKRTLLGFLLCICCLTTPAAATAATQPPPQARAAGIGTDIAGAFAGKLATGGASYLIGKLQDGALGSTGVSIGNFLSDAGLGGNSAEFAEVKEQLNAVSERLVGLQQQVTALDSKLDQLGASVANGNYSILVAFANKLRSAVLTGDRKLRAIAAAPAGERRSLAEDFVDFYKRELQDKELEFHGYLTGNGVPGAEGILKIASRKARSAAQPFFTYTMSLFPLEVANDYAMVEAVWLEERVNVMNFEHKSPEQIQAAINEAKEASSRDYREIPSLRLFPNTVIDTRTNIMWSWRINPSGCDSKYNEILAKENRITELKALRTKPADWPKPLLDAQEELRTLHAQYTQCLYDHGADANQAAYDERPSRNSIEPTNGSPPAGWKRPSVEQIKALDGGASGSVPSWLNARGGFPSRITGEVWTSARSGNSATTVNQSTGSVQSRDVKENEFTLLQGETVGAWYWVQ
jgi:hypothetical protein